MEDSGEATSESYYPSHQINSLKRKLYGNFMNQLHKEVFAELYSGKFMVPERVISKMDDHQSTRSTADSDQHSGNKNAKSTVVEEWKINLITTVLLSFEERCLVARTMDGDQLKEFRSLNRMLLTSVLSVMPIFKNQKYSSIAASILMINASKMKMPKGQFTEAMEQDVDLKRLNLVSIAHIKKSKVYALIKKIIHA